MSYADKKKEKEMQKKETKNRDENKVKVVINPSLTEHLNNW